MQKKLAEYLNIQARKHLTYTADEAILEWLAQGEYAQLIARRLEITPVAVHYRLKKLEKAGIIEKEGRGNPQFWNVKNRALGVRVGKNRVCSALPIPSKSMPAVSGERGVDVPISAGRRVFAGSGGALERGGEPEGLPNSAVNALVSPSPLSRNGMWKAHHVRGSAGVRREGDWVKVRRLAHRINRITPNQFIFYFNDCTLTLRRKSVQVEVFGLKSQDEKRLYSEASGKARVVLADFMRDFGFQFNEFEWRKPVHWVLSKELSKDILRFKPDLADGSHPEQVEVYTSEARGAISSLVDGSLLARIAGLELVVKTQAIALERLVSKLEGK